MPRTVVSQIIRRSVLLHLSLAAPGLMGCGGETDPARPYTEPDASGQASDAGDGGPSCMVLSTTPIASQIGGSCPGWAYTFDGTSLQCGLSEPIGQNLCAKLCPPPPVALGDAGRLTDCTTYPCGGNVPFIPACSTGTALACNYSPCALGRRPAGLLPAVVRRALLPIPRVLAQMAHIEAASVPAFERLARELAAHGAPQRLCRAALRAACDEVRHARVITALAERAGAVVEQPRVRRGSVRSLEAIAIENAVEGCVHETFGAAVAMVQSMTASDPRVRAAMRRISPDEMRHAELSWSVACWLDSRLAAAAHARVARARRRAARALVRNASSAVDPALVDRLGIPDARQARAIALDLANGLWMN